ncbi:MAG: winged helix-turn-helix domain-containing protein [Candidatus Hodarchaeota archaeon]
MNETNHQNGEETTPNSEIPQTMMITDPKNVSILYHEKKPIILEMLIEQEMSIIDLKNATGWNPGTIKRHLDDLVERGFISQTRIERNIYGIKVKYYRAKAKQFIFHVKWPKK